MKRSVAREEFLKDVLITAVEGGINYWASVDDYEPYKGTVTIIEEEEGAPFKVTMDTVAKGIGIARKERIGSMIGLEYVKQFWLADETNGEDGDYDADIADQIIQLAIFGKVVYGG